MTDFVADHHYARLPTSRFERAVVSVVRPPDGWTIASVKPYVGSMSYLVWEFVKGDRCVTLYGDVLAVQDAIHDNPAMFL